MNFPPLEVIRRGPAPVNRGLRFAVLPGMVNPASQASAPGDGSLWRAWILACVLGEMLGIGAASFIVGSATGMIGDPGSTRARFFALAAALVAGVVEGTVLGFFEWRVLKRRFTGVTAGAWIGVTATIAALGWLAGVAPSVFAPAQPGPSPEMPPGAQLAALTLALLFGGAITGAIFGAAQWLVLRRHALRAGQWVLANALAWPLALAWIFLGAMLPTGSTGPGMIFVIGLVSGILAGVTYGTITGAFLLRIFPLPGAEVGTRAEETRTAA